MFSKAFVLAVSLVAAIPSLVLAHPLPRSLAAVRDSVVYGSGSAELFARETHKASQAGQFAEIQDLLKGNQQFVAGIEQTNPGLLKALALNGQNPEFMIYSCSDSRASEGTIFNAAPGTFFTQRNIANQFVNGDINSESVLAYGITVLGVKHILVVGHYGCGGVAASIASAPEADIDVASGIVQSWIDPVRQLYLTSTREEIVTLRTANEALGKPVGEPEINEPGFRALVEENVKFNVKKIAESSTVKNAYRRLEQAESNTTAKAKRNEELAEPIPFFIHGWVYDIETGAIKDLNVTVSPPNFKGDPNTDEPPKDSASFAVESAPTPTPTGEAPAQKSSSESAPPASPTATEANAPAASSTTKTTEANASGAPLTATPAESNAPAGESKEGGDPKAAQELSAVAGIKLEYIPMPGASP